MSEGWWGAQTASHHPSFVSDACGHPHERRPLGGRHVEDRHVRALGVTDQYGCTSVRDLNALATIASAVAALHPGQLSCLIVVGVQNSPKSFSIQASDSLGVIACARSTPYVDSNP